MGIYLLISDISSTHNRFQLIRQETGFQQTEKETKINDMLR